MQKTWHDYCVPKRRTKNAHLHQNRAPRAPFWCKNRLSAFFYCLSVTLKKCPQIATNLLHSQKTRLVNTCHSSPFLYHLSAVIPFIAFFIPFVGKECTNKIKMVLYIQAVRNTANSQASRAMWRLVTRVTAYAMQKQFYLWR